MDSRISARGLAQMLGGWRTREPAYEALADGIRLLCLDNRLPARTTLPAERELASALGLSRTTVAAAYRSLRASAHIESIRGSGSVTLPLRRRGPLPAAPGTDDIDLTQASPAAWPGLAGVMSEVAADAAALVARAGYDVVGSHGLRQAIADRYSTRGLPTDVDQVLVTTGAQSAIHLVSDTLLERGARAAIETPTYPHAAEALHRAGARLASIPVSTRHGWDLDRATQVFQRTRPVIAYLMPDFQNPTGRCMTAQERSTISDAAHAAGTVLLVDETTGELGIDAVSTATIALNGASTVRIGSLGKTVWGGLRVGWVRAEPALVRRLIAARPSRELGTPEFEQAVAAKLLPQMSEIVAQRSDLLRRGRDRLTAALRDRLPEWHVPEAAGGVSLWVGLDAPLSSALVMAARGRGLHLSAGSRFSPDGGHENFLRVPFTAPPDDLERAADILGELWPTVRAAAPRNVRALTDAVI